MRQIRQALVERIQTAETGLRVYETPPADGAGNEFPCVMLRAFAGNFTTTFGGSATGFPMDGEMIATVLVRVEEPDEAWQKLEEYLSPSAAKSIAVAVNTDQSLGLDDVAAAVIGFRNASIRTEIGPGIHGADIIIRLIKGS